MGIVSKTHAVLVALKVHLHSSILSYHFKPFSFLPPPFLLPPSSPDLLPCQVILTITLAQRRGTLLLPKKDNLDRRTPGPLPRRPGIRRPRPLQLHEIPIPLFPPNLRPRYPHRATCILHRRPRPNQHSTLRQAPLRRRPSCSRG